MTFSAQIKAYSMKTQTTFDKVVRKATFDVFSGCLTKTPVDTGMLRANWQIGISSRPSGQLAGQLAGSQPEAVNRAMATVGTIKAGGHVYIVNNMPYAMTVEMGLYHGPSEKVNESGYSRQAPAGMARISVKEVADNFDRVMGGSL